MYILYGCPETATFGPHAVLEEAGLPYTRELINTNTGGCRTPEYLAINPAGYVPALKLDDGTIMCEAAAIMLYLADKSGLPDLAPRVDEPQRAPFLRQL
ncbi:MAG: glutathione S-transferase N-terminal domain-containing protein, partial [Rhodospirillales bacterium]|nr:glutathione S-transferase N-terminal domain-containing protein [Rhodospirillales bacterium]